MLGRGLFTASGGQLRVQIGFVIIVSRSGCDRGAHLLVVAMVEDPVLAVFCLDKNAATDIVEFLRCVFDDHIDAESNTYGLITSKKFRLQKGDTLYLQEFVLDQISRRNCGRQRGK